MVEDTRHHFARAPPMRPEHSHVVLLPPFRSHSSAAERLQQQEALSSFQQAHDLIDARVHERCHDAVEHNAARTMFSVTRCSKADNHSQGLQGLRSSVCVVPHVSCLLGRHESALVTTISSCRQRTCREPSWWRDAKPSSGSRTAHPVNIARPSSRSLVFWLYTYLSPAFSVDSAHLSLLAPRHLRLLRSLQTSQPGSSAFPGSRRRRLLGLPARIFPNP